MTALLKEQDHYMDAIPELVKRHELKLVRMGHVIALVLKKYIDDGLDPHAYYRVEEIEPKLEGLTAPELWVIMHKAVDLNLFTRKRVRCEENTYEDLFCLC